jgi:hypothetical protein
MALNLPMPEESELTISALLLRLENLETETGRLRTEIERLQVENTH